MFYCDPCAKVNEWPFALWNRSFGPCEICGNDSECNDVPSSHLPPARIVVRREEQSAGDPP
jgi:hypothetical protein